jgi:hypothetical protein
VPPGAATAASRQPTHLDLELERVTRQHLSAEPAPLDAAKQRELARISLVREQRDRAELGDGLDHEHAGQRGPAGKCPGKNHSSPVNVHQPRAR